MRSFTRFLLALAFLLQTLPLRLKASEADWTVSQAFEAAKAFLRDDTMGRKALRARAEEWLQKLDETELDLKEDFFLKALVLDAAGKPATGEKLLRAEIVKPSGLGYRAALCGPELAHVLPRMIRNAISNKDYDALPLLVSTLYRYGALQPANAFEPLGKRLSQGRNPEVTQARGEIASLISCANGLTPLEKDHFLSLLYGRRSKLPDDAAVEPGPAPVAPTDLADPRFLIMGGGGSYRNNQISLEKNVEFLQRVQRRHGLSSDRNHILFADGAAATRDLQLARPETDEDQLNYLLGAILSTASGLELTYRSHQIEAVNGESSESNIKRFFEDAAFDSGQQLVVNFTGHGGRGPKDDDDNTCIYLWENKTLRMRDFCSLLDKVPEEVPVTLIMVQCYSGGFANVIFKDGDPKKGLSQHPRCGFFATVHDRVAAGCTPAIAEEDYREYSSYFFAALNGSSRTGTPIESADYDGDGRVCFAEAHAYALIASTTLDVSIKTSDAFLRRFSRVGGDPTRPHLELIDTSSYKRLLRVAEPCDLAVLEGLSRELGISGDDRVETARQLGRACERERNANDEEQKRKSRKAGDLRKELSSDLRARWPELSNPWHPEVARLLGEKHDTVLKWIHDHPKGDEFIKTRKEIVKYRDAHYELEGQWARVQRFLRTAENVALAANLDEIADSEIQERYHQLVTLEHGALPLPQNDTIARSYK